MSRQLITQCTVALALQPRRDQDCLSLLRTSFYNGTRIAASADREGEPGNENPGTPSACFAKQHLGFMSFISRIVSSVRELPFGGALGALLDHAADHIAHRHGHGPDLADADRPRRVAFTIAAISLGAKMARADGDITRDEVDAFNEVFRIPPDEEDRVRLVFDLARRSRTRTVLKVALTRLGEWSRPTDGAGTPA